MIKPLIKWQLEQIRIARDAQEAFALTHAPAAIWFSLRLYALAQRQVQATEELIKKFVEPTN